MKFVISNSSLFVKYGHETSYNQLIDGQCDWPRI